MSGVAKRSIKPVASVAAAPEYEAIIVGTGFGGMGAAIQLQRMGVSSILMLDRADDLGGTWHLNTYPGIAVDIASVTYSYSFEPNPHWSRLYAPGRELKAYADHVAQKYGLRPYMRFNSAVEKTVYDEAGKFWTVYPENQAPVTARILILATGYLSQPKRPDIPGLNDFAGKTIHTAEWDHAYDLRGKRAAVIGTGATSVQLLPEIAPQLAHMDVYQRTPIWVVPKPDVSIPPLVRRTFSALPLTQKMARHTSSAILEAVMVTGALYNRELPMLTKAAEQLALAHMRRVIKDPVLREKLTPDYSFGCKRPTFSNTYYPTFNRANVELVTDPVDHIAAEGIVTRAGRLRKIDTLILATGFKFWEKGNFPPFPVAGREGHDLGDWWMQNTYQAYEGISIPGFPNLFNLPSPYSFTGLSYFFTIEAHMKHMARCLGEMKKQGAASFEVDRRANEKYMQRMRRNLGSSVFVNGQCGGSNSYYFNPHGEAAMLRPTPTPIALWEADHFPLEHYRFA